MPGYYIHRAKFRKNEFRTENREVRDDGKVGAELAKYPLRDEVVVPASSIREPLGRFLGDSNSISVSGVESPLWFSSELRGSSEQAGKNARSCIGNCGEGKKRPSIRARVLITTKK